MALDPTVNFFRSEIATLPVTSGAVTIVLATGDGAKLPNPAVDGAFNLTIYNEADQFVAPEIVRVTARTSDTLTVTRAQEGTTATTKTAGSVWTVVLTPTAKTISDIDLNKVNVADIVDNLTSTDTDKPLSANQGKVLQDNKEPADATILKQANIVDNLTSTSTTAPLSANQGKVLQDGKVAKAGDTMTGTLTATKLIPSGNVTAGNGMYLPTTNTLAFSTNGSERVRLDSSGNFGIGTATVASKLHVNVGTDANIAFNSTGGIARISCFDDDAQASSSLIVNGSDLRFTTEVVERMRIDSAGNVGIGTSSPQVLLHLNGPNVSNRGQLVLQAANNNFTQISFYKGNTVSTDAVFQCFATHSTNKVTFQASQSTGFFAFSTGGTTERMTITSAGNVGIGTTSPATPLDVNGTVTGGKFVPTANTTAGNGMYLPAANTLAFSTNGSERVRVDSTGNVAIGTSSILGLLNVNGQVAIGSSGEFKTQIFSGELPVTGEASGLSKFVFDFTFSGTFGTSLITLDLSAGLATTNFAKYIFAVKCSADSGTTAVQEGSTNNVVQIGFSNFTFAATATTRTFTVTITRSGTENWSVFGGYKIEAVNNRRFLTLNSVTAIA